MNNNNDDKNLIIDLGLSDTDIAWLAGLLEGEGSFSLDDRSKERYEESTSPPPPVLKLSMTDKDIIDRVAAMLKKEAFRATEETQGGKIEHIVSSQARPVLFYLLPRILPYLGKRRAQQVQICIDALEAWKKWYLEGGRSKAARRGYDAGIGKKYRM